MASKITTDDALRDETETASSEPVAVIVHDGSLPAESMKRIEALALRRIREIEEEEGQTRQ